MSILTKIKSTADILGGSVFFANDLGFDPEYPNNGDLLPNGMYIRVEGSDGSVAYISAYEIERSIDIIDEMSKTKASQADLTALQEVVESKVSSSDFELLQGDVAAKASKADVDALLDEFEGLANADTVNGILEQLSTKAEQSQVDTIAAAVATKAEQADLTALQEVVGGKADSLSIQQIIFDLAALKETVQVLTNTDTINAINTQIAQLTAELNNKLSSSDLSSINTNISALTEKDVEVTERLGIIENTLSKKASNVYVQGQVNELTGTISNVIQRVENKADKSEVTNKADKTDLTNAVRNINTLKTDVENLKISVDNNYNDANTKFDNKVSKTEFNNIVGNLTNEVASKVDITTYNSDVNRIDTKLNNLEETHSELIGNVSNDFEELECEVNNTLTELRASLNTQSKQLSQQDSKIKKLEDSSSTYNDKLKQPWVRVMSSNEYKKLGTPPEGVPYNDRYKYPNMLYMVVDYNKPKAIYIGDILIAQAEAGGSIGFAYNFPIVF